MTESPTQLRLNQKGNALAYKLKGQGLQLQAWLDQELTVNRILSLSLGSALLPRGFIRRFQVNNLGSASCKGEVRGRKRMSLRSKSQGKSQGSL